MSSLNDRFLDYCKSNGFEVNQGQIQIIKQFENFKDKYLDSSFLDIFKSKKEKKLGIYLHGDVGVGKTMLLDFFFDSIQIKKQRLHFNEFMIKFHDFKFNNSNQDKIIESFVNELKKDLNLIYFDEFQVTNIVDAMILGRLFQEIFSQNIFVFFSSNIKIENLYKDGLQRDQFIPFIKIINRHCVELDLSIDNDYRLEKGGTERFLSPLNLTNNFKANKFFREITKNKKFERKIFKIKGRNFEVEKFYDGIIRLDFKDLCDQNVGAEDYIEIANNCSFLFIENVPNFCENNSNQQQRFITMIDILYEKNIPLLITSEINLNEFNSSQSLKEVFKRTISRLNELTSARYL